MKPPGMHQGSGRKLLGCIVEQNNNGPGLPPRTKTDRGCREQRLVGPPGTKSATNEDLAGCSWPRAAAGLVRCCKDGSGMPLTTGEAWKLPSLVTKTGESRRREPVAMDAMRGLVGSPPAAAGATRDRGNQARRGTMVGGLCWSRATEEACSCLELIWAYLDQRLSSISSIWIGLFIFLL